MLRLSQIINQIKIESFFGVETSKKRAHSLRKGSQLLFNSFIQFCGKYNIPEYIIEPKIIQLTKV